MPSKRMSKRSSRKVRKTSKQVRRSSKSMKGGAKRRTSKRSSKRSVKKISNTSNRKSKRSLKHSLKSSLKRNQKGGKGGKVELKDKTNEKNVIILIQADINKAKSIIAASTKVPTTPLLLNNAMLVANLQSSLDNYDSVSTIPETINAVNNIRAQKI